MGGPVSVAALGNFLNRLRIFCDVPDRPAGARLKAAVLAVLVAAARKRWAQLISPLNQTCSRHSLN